MPRRTAIATAAGAIAGSQLLHDVLHVDLDRLFEDEQPLGDVAIPVAAGHVLSTSISRSSAARRRCAPRAAPRPSCGIPFLPGMDLPDHFDQVAGGVVLRTCPARPAATIAESRRPPRRSSASRSARRGTRRAIARRRRCRSCRASGGPSASRRAMLAKQLDRVAAVAAWATISMSS